MFLVHIALHTYQYPQHIHLSLGLNYHVAHLVYYVGLKAVTRTLPTQAGQKNNNSLAKQSRIIHPHSCMYNVHTYTCNSHFNFGFFYYFCNIYLHTYIYIYINYHFLFFILCCFIFQLSNAYCKSIHINK